MFLDAAITHLNPTYKKVSHVGLNTLFTLALYMNKAKVNFNKNTVKVNNAFDSSNIINTHYSNC